MALVQKNPSSLALWWDHRGGEGPKAGHVVLSCSQQKAITTGNTGHFTVPMIVDDRVGLDAKIWKAGVYIMKGGDVPTEDWDATSIVSLSAFKLEKVSPIDRTLTTITSKGNWFSGVALTTIVNVSSLSAGVGTLIDNADEVAYFEIDVENFSAAFANNTTNSHDLLRFYIQIANATSGTVNPIVMPFVFIDWQKG